MHMQQMNLTVRVVTCNLIHHPSAIAEEQDFVVNYDVKYRTGVELEDGDE